MRTNWTIRGTSHHTNHTENSQMMTTTMSLKPLMRRGMSWKRGFAHFEEDMRAAGKHRSSSKRNAPAKKIWDVRAGVRKLKAIVEKIWVSAKNAKTIQELRSRDTEEVWKVSGRGG